MNYFATKKEKSTKKKFIKTANRRKILRRTNYEKAGKSSEL
jgi:hypothetical protein